MVKMMNYHGSKTVYPNWNNGSILYIPKSMFSSTNYLMLINQCIGECDIFVEALFKVDLDDEFIANTFTTLPEGNFYYNSYKYKENTDLYVFSETNRYVIKINGEIVVGTYSKFFKMNYIDLKSYSSLSDEYLPILITGYSEDNITVYQKNNEIINDYFYNSKYSSPLDYKYVNGTATETLNCPKYLNYKYAIHVLSENDLTFTFILSNKNSITKEVKAQQGAVFTYDNGVDYSATFLPEVAEEEGWDQRTTLKYLVRKAGYRGSLDKVLSRIKCKRYQSIKKTISYNEYKKMK
jgi:hypothetical protein